VSKVFDAYAAYYDLLYRDKDYAGEATYVGGLIHRFRPDARDILELGCGTGLHARELVRQGYTVTGIDRSELMVQRANERASALGAGRLMTFMQGDLRDFRAGRTFDVVVSLFHVMSYQTTNADLRSAMSTAFVHLRAGGIFIFDCWYGPAVLTDPPTKRVRKLQSDVLKVTRTAEPDHHPNHNRVDVRYEILVERDNEDAEKIAETHAMRYLFAPEVDLLLDAAGLRRVALERWLGGDAGTESWNACFVATR
jgi:SAM-dependent methyltransferase